MKRLFLLLAVPLLGCPGSPPRPGPSATARGGSGMSVLLVSIDTLRADHLGAYGYRRRTSPQLDAIAARGTLFEEAYTYWPKTRGSFAALLTGRRAAQSGYSKTHPFILDLNPTLASILKGAGYETTALVDNANLARGLGYAKGFDRYRETWEEKALAGEMDRARAITEEAVALLGNARPDRPFLLWLHYVNPHAPYNPPPPFDRRFVDDAAGGPRLAVVAGFHGGIPKQWAVAGQDRLAFYVAQYDGEIAAVDQEVGRVAAALEASAVRDHTALVVTSDHGESLGEHDYYFDHGEDVFDASLRIPLIVVVPGAPAGRRLAFLASTLDIVPTLLDAAKVSYPPDLAGESLLGAVLGGRAPRRERLYAQNDRSLSASFDYAFKVVATPEADRLRFSLYDRKLDREEAKDVAASRPEALRVARRELELFLENSDREWARTRPLVEGKPGEARLSREACDQMKALGYVQRGCE